MRTWRWNVLARRVAGATLVAAIALAAGAHPVRAASPDFGTPRAVSTFTKGIDFSQPYSGPAFTSAEISLVLPGSIAPFIVQLESQSSSSLVYTLDASKGQLLPNMKIVATFAVSLSNGTVETGPPVTETYTDTSQNVENK